MIAMLVIFAMVVAGHVAATGNHAPAAATSGSGVTPPSGAVGVVPHVPNDVRLVRTRRSLLGRHNWYRQVVDGHFVVGGWFATHYDKFRKQYVVWDHRRDVHATTLPQPSITSDEAHSFVTRATQSPARRRTHVGLWVLAGSSHHPTPRLVYAVSTADGHGARTSYVDAVDGRIVKVVHSPAKTRVDQGQPVIGRGRVFDPNPVVRLQDQSLRDHGDADSAVPRRAYKRVELRGLGNAHQLVGRWVRIANAHRAHSRSNTYLFNRSHPFFEQTSAYYGVHKQQAFLQSLGFRDVNAESQEVVTNAFANDNSYYDTQADRISLGSGGVDDAEDLEVVWHEYGHAMQSDQVIDFGRGREARSIGEGFGDYIAVAMSQGAQRTGTPRTPLACVMDWDATAYTVSEPHCLRRVDRDVVYPRDLTGSSHHDGGIWARALWDMNLTMGRADATRVAVESHFWMRPNISMPQGARIMAWVASRLTATGLVALGSPVQVRNALLARNLLP